MSKKDFRNNYVGFEHLSFPTPKVFVSEASARLSEEDNIFNEIFVPDPNTGVAAPDIFLMLNRSTDPVVREYISNVLMRSMPEGTKYDNADLALELIRRDETEEQYVDRLKGIINESVQVKI